MAEDVWDALVQDMLAFARARANDLIGGAFKDAGALVGALFAASPAGTAKTRLQQLAAEIQTSSAAGAATVAAVKPQTDKAASAAQAMGNALGISPPTAASLAE